MSFKIYSIESRKGGVGKTTIALNLAKLLLKKGPVLLLDCDITGTSIAEPAKNSPFWTKETHVLNWVDSEGEEHELNLLRYFLDEFVKGRGQAKSFINVNNVRASKINVVGSLIGGNAKKALEKTMWLMDELHSYWFMEFIRIIINEYESLFPDKTVHVVIDTSPGFTGFNQALHEVMCEEGPDNSKILMVTTLDGQDIQATTDAVQEYSKKINDRMRAAQYFKKTEAQNVSEEDDDVEVVEYRDEDVESLIAHNDEIKNFFFRLTDETKMFDAYTKKEYNVSNYLGIVLNKVPQSIRDNNTEISFADMLKGRNYPLFCELTSAIDNAPQAKIFFEEAISYQYYLHYMRKSIDVKDEYWSRRYRDLEMQIYETESLDKIAAAEKLRTLYVNLRQNLRDRKFSQIARQMTEAWSPTYGLETFKRDLTYYSRYTRQSLGIEPNVIKDMLHVWIFEQIQALQDLLQGREDIRPLESMMAYMENYAGYEKALKKENLMLSLALVLHAFVAKITKDYRPDNPIDAYIRAEINNFPFGQNWGKLIGDHITVNPQLTILTDPMIKTGSEDFDKLYKSFCLSWLRLEAVQSDFRVILAALKLYVPTSPGEAFNNEMRDYINAVIGKTAVYSADTLSEIKAKSYVMKSVQDVLKNYILNKWN